MRRIIIAGWILLLVLAVTPLSGPYHHTPLQAFAEQKNRLDYPPQLQLVMVQSEDDAIVIYLDKTDSLCAAPYYRGIMGWQRADRTRRAKNPIEYVDDQAIHVEFGYNSYQVRRRQVVYGVTTPVLAASVRINGLQPSLYAFSLKNTKYMLWYYNGGDKLDDHANTNITYSGGVVQY